MNAIIILTLSNCYHANQPELGQGLIENPAMMNRANSWPLVVRSSCSVETRVREVTVPVGCGHQVYCVPGVLSMENVSPHMYGVRPIEKEIFEKMQF